MKIENNFCFTLMIRIKVSNSTKKHKRLSIIQTLSTILYDKIMTNKYSKATFTHTINVT